MKPFLETFSENNPENPTSILLVEDEIASASLLINYLNKSPFSFNLHHSFDSTEAIEYCKSNHPDLILMDIDIPGDKDGVETILKIYEFLLTPVIYITAKDDEKTLSRAIKTTPYGYLRKPFEEINLLVTIRTALVKADADYRIKKKFEIQQQDQKLEMIGSLAAGIAHDFNNILAIIHSHAEVLSLKKQSDEKTHRYIEKICNASQKGADLVKSLMRFSRHEEPIEISFCPSDIIVETIVMLQRLIPRSIQIHADIPDKIKDINANPSEIQQIIINLCLNARDALGAKGNIYISAKETFGAISNKLKESKKYLCIRVSDDGPGVPENIKDQVFNPFYTSKSKDYGTGLGLSTSLDTAKKIGGHLELTTSNKAGAHFQLFLPFVE